MDEMNNDAATEEEVVDAPAVEDAEEATEEASEEEAAE